MSHVRQQIRDAAVAALTGLPITGSRVEAGRVRPLPDNHQPTLFVYTTVEPVETRSVAHPATQLRRVQLAIEGRLWKPTPCQDDLDDVAVHVEKAVAADPTFGRLAQNTVLTETRSDVDASANRHDGAIRLVYVVTYVTKANTPDVAG